MEGGEPQNVEEQNHELLVLKEQYFKKIDLLTDKIQL